MKSAVAFIFVTLLLQITVTKTVYANDWAAVAYCPHTGNVGYSVRQPGKFKALRAAQDACKRAAINREDLTADHAERCCLVVYNTNKGCMVATASSDSRKTYSVTVPNRRRKYDAIKSAMSSCMKEGQYCRPLVVVCGGNSKGKRETDRAPLTGVAKAIPAKELN